MYIYIYVCTIVYAHFVEFVCVCVCVAIALGGQVPEIFRPANLPQHLNPIGTKGRLCLKGKAALKIFRN